MSHQPNTHIALIKATDWNIELVCTYNESYDQKQKENFAFGDHGVFQQTACSCVACRDWSNYKFYPGQTDACYR
jgi:hypothetical protein